MATTAKTSNSGIVTDDSGQRHIPESTRADGSTRKAIKIRPGYRPPEDVELYKNRTAEAFRNRGKGGGIPGAEGLKDDESKDATSSAASAASLKNAKRREARKKAKAAEEEAGKTEEPAAAVANGDAKPVADAVDPEVEKEKKIRNLKKKLKQAKELEQKKEGGGSLLPEQIAKVIKINELIRELQSLGIDAEDSKKENGQGEAGEKKD
ncbi:hypothetical protein MCOR25_003369 [Pyricularia grisea]|uniref:WIBG Mago-binding domain-containing protein n=1 Tax=Pyricularia grisea TaxID=148305 RepID=A0A6P8BAE0_PYRGI|nr:uncharacterized protein PgNI_03110 [Pyricularia grisea]KAI6373740.1 hypothetical protein MCOR25_003369 [Pyricularia grisea]TLD12783.1 hypothetical protein PgNI_03110 [Pyricularia grisea]